MRIALLVLLAATLSVRAFEILNFPEEIPESNPVTRTRVADARTQFSFITPNSWTAQVDSSAKRITLQCASPRATIILAVSTNAMPENAAQFKQMVAGQFEDETILSEFPVPTGGAAGLGIDVRHSVGGRIQVMTRVAVFRTPDGLVEVRLGSSPQDFETLHNAWTGFINSFRVEQRIARPAPPAQ